MHKALLIQFIFAVVTTIYNFQLSSIDGNAINFRNFQGRKILIVNTASGSRYVSQYASLEKFYQKHKDSIVVIAIPSNSFGNEPDNAVTIQQLIRDKYGGHYLVAGKTEVNGPGQSALYKWLTRSSENQILQSKVAGDFQKYLISSKGQLIGYVIPAIDPMDSLIQKTMEEISH